jgi:hypothetical protein
MRYNVDGESQIFLVATRDISEGGRLYYDYIAHENQYPTHHFVWVKDIIIYLNNPIELSAILDH